MSNYLQGKGSQYQSFMRIDIGCLKLTSSELLILEGLKDFGLMNNQDK
jgi:hypothetical protein